MENSADDTEKLLKSVTNSKGTTAWDDFGSTGWGEDGTSAFMTKRSTPHTTDSHIKARKSYSKCDNVFVGSNEDLDNSKYASKSTKNPTCHYLLARSMQSC